MSSTATSAEGGPHLDADTAPGASRTRNRPALWAFVGVLALLLLVALSWIGLRLSQAQDHLSKARAQVPILQKHLVDGDAAAAAADLRVIRSETAKARSSTNDVIVRAGASVPYLGRTPHAARSLADISDVMAAGPLPRLVTASLALSPNRLRTSGDTIDVRGLESAALPLRTAVRELDVVTSELRDMSRGPLVLDPLDNARATLLANVSSLQSTAIVAGRFASVGPPMLGASGTRRYFVALTNPNEARATGGVLGGYQILEARQGKLRIVESGPATKLPQLHSWLNANRSPHFPTAASTWASLWESSHSGKPRQHIDGVISLDPLALSQLLAATGPVNLRRGQPVNTNNIVNRVTQRYATAQNPLNRDGTLAGVTARIVGAVLDGAGNTQNLATRLGRTSGRGHLQLWSSRSDEEVILAQAPIGGVLDDTKQPYAGVVVSNIGGNKLDGFLSRSVTYFAGGCGSTKRDATIVVRLSNEAPQGLPGFLTTRTDRPPKGTPAEQTRYEVAVYAAAGAQLRSANLDGAELTMRTQSSRGHPVFTTNVSIDRRTTRTLTLQLNETTLAGVPTMPVQPLLRPQENVLDAPTCGGRR